MSLVLSNIGTAGLDGLKKDFKKNLNSHVDNNPQDETIKPTYSVCFSGAQTLSYLRAHEHLPNALPSLHNRYRVSQLPPSALF